MIESVEKAKSYLKTLPDVKQELPCVILIQGKQIRLPSGKTTWKNKGAARSAFSNALYGLVDWRIKADVRKQLEEEGFVEFKTFEVK